MKLDSMFLRAEELGVRLEIVGDLPIWEAQPLYRHQKHVDRISGSIQPTDKAVKQGCACLHIRDVYIKFQNGLKRPDISILCKEPPEEEQEQALTTIPEAVIEVVSKGYEAKDLQIGPPFYLSQGVKDIVVFDPTTLLVLHVRKEKTRRLTSPVKLDLECGCVVTV